MKKIIFLFFVSISGVSAITAQSVRREVDAVGRSVEDTVSVNRLLQSGQAYRDDQPDSAIYFYTLAGTLAARINDRQGLSNAYKYLFLLFFKAGKYEESMDLARQEIAIGDQWKDNEILMKGYNNLAIANQYLSDYQTASENYLKAAEFANKIGDQAKEAKIFENMGSVFLSLEDFKTAYHYGHRSYQLSKERKDSANMLSGLITIAAAESGLKRYDTALQHLDEGETMATQLHNMLKIAVIMENKALIYLEQGKATEAVAEFQKTWEIADKYNIPYMRMESLNGLANAEIIRKKYAKADQYITRAIAIGEKLDLDAELSKMYYTLATIKQMQGKFSASVFYKNKYEQLNDSLMNVQINTNINRLNIQYHTVQKDKEILLQKLQLAQNQTIIQKKNTWILLFILGLTTLTLILFISYRDYRNKKSLHEKTVLSLQKEQEVIRLKAMMEGQDQERQRISREMHDDIGSGLTSILFLSSHLKNNAPPEGILTVERITNNVNSLISKMNEIIWSMNKDYDTLDDLVAYIRHNIGEWLETTGLSYLMDIPENIPSLEISGKQRRNFYLAVKEALHNIIKHANARKVDIVLRMDEGIHMMIQDNGKGIDPEQLRRFGNGLKNMRQRMDAVGGTFEITTNNGTRVNLFMPLPG